MREKDRACLLLSGCLFLFKPTGSNLALVAGHTLLKPGFKHLKHSCVRYSWEHFLSLWVFFCTFRSIATYVKKNNKQWREVQVRSHGQQWPAPHIGASSRTRFTPPVLSTHRKLFCPNMCPKRHQKEKPRRNGHGSPMQLQNREPKLSTRLLTRISCLCCHVPSYTLNATETGDRAGVTSEQLYKMHHTLQTAAAAESSSFTSALGDQEPSLFHVLQSRPRSWVELTASSSTSPQHFPAKAPSCSLVSPTGAQHPTPALCQTR